MIKLLDYFVFTLTSYYQVLEVRPLRPLLDCKSFLALFIPLDSCNSCIRRLFAMYHNLFALMSLLKIPLFLTALLHCVPDQLHSRFTSRRHSPLDDIRLGKSHPPYFSCRSSIDRSFYPFSIQFRCHLKWDTLEPFRADELKMNSSIAMSRVVEKVFVEDGIRSNPLIRDKNGKKR